MNAREPIPPDDNARAELAALLARRPLRPAPAELRISVLRAAANVGQATSVPTARPSWWELLLARFPVTTGALAACGLVVWCGAAADRWMNGPPATAAVSVSAEQVAAARAERAELFQLAGMDEGRRAVQPRPRQPDPVTSPNRPRGDRRRDHGEGFGRIDSGPAILSA